MTVRTYVIFGGTPYDSSANQTALQTFAEIAKTSRVVYVSRRFQQGGLLNLFRGGQAREGRKVRHGLRQVAPSAWVLTLPRLCDALPMSRPEPVRRIQLWLIRRCLQRALLRLRLESPALTAYWWMFPELISWDIWSETVFDIIDRHWGYEGQPLHSSQVSMRHVELTARASDRVVCVSTALAKELEGWGVQSAVVPNAVDLDRVRRVVEGVGPGARRPQTAVYAGGWNARVDRELLLRVAVELPEWSFRIVGSSGDEGFSRLQNVTFMGPMSYDKVVAEISTCDVGLVPFVESKFTEASSFLKVLDYLAAGAAVLSTDLAGMRHWSNRFPESVHVASGSDAWVTALQQRSANQSLGATTDMSRYSSTRRVHQLFDFNGRSASQ